MEYSTDMLLCSGESTVLCISRLLTSFDETVAVMPYRSSRAVSRYDMWLEPKDEKKIVVSYVGGTCLTREGVRLFLRHRAVTADEIAKAEAILADYSLRLAEVLEPTEVWRAETGNVLHCGTDDTVWDFCTDIDILRYESAEGDGVKFYVSFGGGVTVPVGAGCMTFKEVTCGETYSRRYFDEKFYRLDALGEGSSIKFEFEAHLSRCALRPVLIGEDKVRVYKVLDTGEAELREYVVTEMSVSGGVCSGAFKSTGDVARGVFDFEIGVFLPDKIERTVEM